MRSKNSNNISDSLNANVQVNEGACHNTPNTLVKKAFV